MRKECSLRKRLECDMYLGWVTHLLKMDTLTCYSFWEGSIGMEIFTSLLVDDFIPHHAFYPLHHPLKDNLVRSSYDVSVSGLYG